MPEHDPTPEEPKSLGGRIRSIPGRTKLLIAVGVLLAFIFTTGRCSGVEIEKDQAIATARAALERSEGAFVPEQTAARIVHQGVPTTAVWVVVFTTSDPDGGRNDYLRRANVSIDARTGEVFDFAINRIDSG